MSGISASDKLLFKQQEQTGWDNKAIHYSKFAGEVTRNAAQMIISALDLKPNSRLLDIATGPGYVAGYASQHGAIVTGIDYASGMIAEAKKYFPAIEFQQGDAESLTFEDNLFDFVTCAFGLLHFADPDKAITEAYRVLKPGGYYAFTVWSVPERHDFFRIILSAVEKYGNMDIPLPQAPPIFRFSEESECRRVMGGVGFEHIQVSELPLSWHPETAEDLLLFLEKSSVRTAMILEHQQAEDLANIHRAITEDAQQFKSDRGFKLSWPAVLAIGQKPL